jgi:hypothetical protein
MTIATVSQQSGLGLPRSLRTAQEAIHHPEVQEMLRRLSQFNLGVFMPHMHDEQLVSFSLFRMMSRRWSRVWNCPFKEPRKLTVRQVALFLLDGVGVQVHRRPRPFAKWTRQQDRETRSSRASTKCSTNAGGGALPGDCFNLIKEASLCKLKLSR